MLQKSSKKTKTWSGHANFLALKMPAALASVSHCCEWSSMWLGSSMIHLALQELLTHEFHSHSSKAFPLVCQHSNTCCLTSPSAEAPNDSLHPRAVSSPVLSSCAPSLQCKSAPCWAGGALGFHLPCTSWSDHQSHCQGSKQGVGVTCTCQKASLLCSRPSPTTTTLPPKLTWLPQSSWRTSCAQTPEPMYQDLAAAMWTKPRLLATSSHEQVKEPSHGCKSIGWVPWTLKFSTSLLLDVHPLSCHGAMANVLLNSTSELGNSFTTSVSMSHSSPKFWCSWAQSSARFLPQMLVSKQKQGKQCRLQVCTLPHGTPNPASGGLMCYLPNRTCQPVSNKKSNIKTVKLVFKALPAYWFAVCLPVNLLFTTLAPTGSVCMAWVVQVALLP